MKKYSLGLLFATLIFSFFSVLTVDASVSGCMTGDRYSRTTGQACTTGGSSVCQPGEVYNAYTGERCVSIDQPSVTLVSQNITASASDEGDFATGTFKFKVYSPSRDIFISRLNTKDSLQTVTYYGGISDLDSAVLTSNRANRDTSSYFIVKSGQYRSFELAFVMKPTAGTGFYKAKAVSLKLKTGNPINFGSEFVTENVMLRGDAVTPTNSTIKVLSPNGGEVWQTGSSQTIRWNVGNSNNISYVDFTLRGVYDNSVHDLYLHARNTGSLTFTLPSSYTTGAYFLQLNKTNGTLLDESNSYFIITKDTNTPFITVLSPNGGDTYISNLEYAVNYYSKTTANICHYMTPRKNLYATRYKVSCGTGYQPWNTNDSGSIVLDSRVFPLGTYYWLSILENADGESAYDFSDASFEIVNGTIPAPVISSLSPTSGPVGTQVSITGTNFSYENTINGQGTSGDFQVHTYSYNGRTLSFVIPAELANTSWAGQPVVPGVYKIQVGSTNGSSNKYNFTVTASNPVVKVLSPNGGENLSIGTINSVTWTGDSSATYDISLVAYYPPCPHGACGQYEDRGPYVLAKNLSVSPSDSQGTFRWWAGRAVDSVNIPAGTYMLKVCKSGKDVCDLSNMYFYLSSGVSVTPAPNPTPAISSLSRISGSVGSAVTINGSGFSATSNTINFGSNVIPNIASTNNGTKILFDVPAYSSPACLFTVPACALRAMLISPGTYKVSVYNKDSLSTSNEISFSVVNPTVDPVPAPTPVPVVANRELPTGTLDQANCSAVAGWARDPDSDPTPGTANSTVTVKLFNGPSENGLFLAQFSANAVRESAVGSHGFVWPLPDSLKDGQSRNIHAYAFDAQDGTKSKLLNGSPKQVTCSSTQAANAGQGASAGGSFLGKLKFWNW